MKPGRKPNREIYGQISFFGAPPVPLVPEKDFDRKVLEYGEIEAMWDIIGPSLHVNLKNGVPLWKAVAMCYMQGVMNGTNVTIAAIESGKMHVNVPRIQDQDFIGGALSG